MYEMNANRGVFAPSWSVSFSIRLCVLCVFRLPYRRASVVLSRDLRGAGPMIDVQRTDLIEENRVRSVETKPFDKGM